MDKKARRSEATKRSIVEKMKLVDDKFFEAFIADADACEELLQVILEKPKLKIKKSTLAPQKNFSFVEERSVRVDAYVEGTEDQVFNIEIQKNDSTDHLKRVRYNAACITVKRSEPGDSFENVQELYVIYISTFDVFNAGKAVYYVEPCIRQTGEFVDNGFHQIYVNTCCDDGSRVARLMGHFEETSFWDDEFPKISRRVDRMKRNEEEVVAMTGIIEEYAKEYAKEHAEEYAEEYVKKHRKEQDIRVSIETMLECTDMSERDIIERITQKFNLAYEEAKSCYEDCKATTQE